MVLIWGNRSTRRETFDNASVSTTDLTGFNLGSNLGFRCQSRRL